MENNYFDILNGLNVNEHTEKKKSGSTELTYLSWSWAVAEVLKKFPDMTYKIMKFQDKNGNLVPYMYDENTGYMCMTEVTIGGITREMWLPVMDGANKAMKKEKYTYSVKEYKWDNASRRNIPTGKMVEKEVEPATMFDINKTIMRCLTKNFAMFGLGLYIYSGEDLPETDEDKEPEKTPAQKSAETRQKNKESKEEYLSQYEAWMGWFAKHTGEITTKSTIAIDLTIKGLERFSLNKEADALRALLEKAQNDKIPEFKPEEYLRAG